VSLGAGVAGAAYLARLNPVVRRWTVRVALVGASAGAAAVVGLLWVSLA
jgi:hypothetical protein